jgi:vitamin B12 transporter
LVFRASDAITLNASMLASGKRLDSAFSPAETGGYALLNLGAELRLGDAWSADLRLENIFDRAYETALGYPQAGRSAFLRVRYNHRVAARHRQAELSRFSSLSVMLPNV